MEIIELRNEFCAFPWAKSVPWSFESVIYGDTKTLVLSPRHKGGDDVLYGMIQVWDIHGEDLQMFHASQWARLTGAPAGFPPGVTVERFKVEGVYESWVGISNMQNAEKFVDYELMARGETTIVYLRRSSICPEEFDIAQELSMIKVADPQNWKDNMPLQRNGE